jgi:hypothetical protein
MIPMRSSFNFPKEICSKNYRWTSSLLRDNTRRDYDASITANMACIIGQSKAKESNSRISMISSTMSKSMPKVNAILNPSQSTSLAERQKNTIQSSLE